MIKCEEPSIPLSIHLHLSKNCSLSLLDCLNSFDRMPVSLSLFYRLSLSSPLKADQTASFSSTRLFTILPLRESVKPDLLTLVSPNRTFFIRTYVRKQVSLPRRATGSSWPGWQRCKQASGIIYTRHAQSWWRGSAGIQTVDREAAEHAWVVGSRLTRSPFIPTFNSYIHVYTLFYRTSLS